MSGTLNSLLIACLLQGALCGKFETLLPQTMEVLSGSCVTIPCSFDVTAQYESNLDSTCKALWRNDKGAVVFDSSKPQQTTINGELTGDLTRKDCTTTLNNMQPAYSNKYYFRIECNVLKNNFPQQISISVEADPPRPTLTPSTLKVKEGTSVSLTCSAPAPCLSHPPTLMWTSGLGDSQETLQEIQDKTKVKTSVVNFTASHHHHGKTISCTAVYSKEDGSTESTVSPSLTADISCALCGEFKALMPQTIEVLSGSCVTIPCSFDVTAQYESNLDSTCKAVWKKDRSTVVFDSGNSQQTTIKGELKGDLTRKDCTTTLNNMQPSYTNNYFFKVECNNNLKNDFLQQISISVKADPPRPTLTPSTLKVKEGTSVSLMCSAPAPCLSHPPTLMWTSGLGVSQETLQENQDKTKVKTSVVNFTASHHHHGKTISCTAVYNKQDGSTESTVITSLTADVSYSPKDTTVSVHPSGPVPEGSNVTLTCSSTANPAVRSYTWYRADGGQETVVGTGHVLTIKASKDDGPFFCKAQNDIGAGRSDNSHIDVQYSPKNTTVSVHPSGPVPEGRDVTLTCSSTANPAVRSYTWYRADGGQEIVVGTGHVLTIKASKDDGPFFCQAENDIGAGRSDLTQIDVQYSPKNTTVSVHPSGPVPEGRDVTLTCSSTANPAVRSYTWYRADGGQETVIGTGHVLIIKASKDNGPFFCQAENDIGAGRSNLTQIDVQFAPQILPSSDCTKTAAQLSCSCRTVGNPSPTLEWYLDGLPVNHTGKLLISNESLNDTGLRSIITVNQPQETDLSTLLCRSSNSLGSASQRFCVNSLEPQTSAHSHDRVTLPVFITTVVTLLVLVCALLFVNRAQKTQRNLPKSQCTDDTSAVTMSQPLTSGEGNEVPNTAEEDIYVNTNALRQTDVAQPATVSEPDSANLPSSGPNNAEGASKSSEKKKEENDVIYSSVNWKTKSKKKTGEDCVDMYQPVRSHLEEERCMVGGTSRSFVNASEMGILYDTVKPGNVEKEVESEYAQVKFKDKSSMHK
ncbi:myelin-associated glycoprotein-like isoform X4 [Sebastes umbrosus]|uniref:myelin-associated glycoprotein-like isoform X4 n=1 Tax=Sebastes umbrosus TaxID=72105 RepID=UPI00189CAA5B|nr:myelin-associated glycoprotein-like isoform X4 [Sebastes umbrosus]